MSVRDFVVRNGLQVTSNILVGDYVYSEPSDSIANGMAASGNVGVGTSTVRAGDRLNIVGGNVNIGTSGFGLVFPDGTFQTTAPTGGEAGAVGGTGAVQYANGTAFAGDSTKLYFDAENNRLGIGTNVLTESLRVAGDANITASTGSTSSATGAIVTAGGVGIGGNINVGGTHSFFANNLGVGTTSTAGVAGDNVVSAFGNVQVSGTLHGDAVIAPQITANAVTLTHTVDVTGTYTTAATTDQVVIDSFSGAAYRAAEYQISMKQGTNYAISRLTVIHDGATAYLTEYDSANTNGFLADFQPGYDAGTVTLSAAPLAATVTEFKISRRLWVV